MLKVVHDADQNGDESESGVTEPSIDLDEICRRGAQEMLATALLTERQLYIETYEDVLDAAGRRMVVGNGFMPERTITTGIGGIEVAAPRVHDRREDESFSSSILPKYMRKSPKVSEVLPILYLRGLSTGDFAPALEAFLGSDSGLSPKTIQRLTEAWQAERDAWAERDLSGCDYVYWWVDGIWFNVRLEADRLCCLVIVGVRPDGTKELVACADGYRESTESWADVLRDLAARGLAAPKLAVGDGALGFWAAVRDVFACQVKEQRCWVHRTANVLSALPDRLHARAKSALAEIYTAPTRADALDAAKRFADEFADFPKATTKILDDLDELLAFYDFPKEHWTHLRSTNPIESTFATVRLRQRRTKGAGNRRAALAMAYKLADAAQHRWRKINAPHLAAVAAAGGVFHDGELVERPDNERNNTDTQQREKSDEGKAAA